MSTTPVGTVAPGDTIEADTQNTMRDNIIVLDTRTGGDPGAAGKILTSSGIASGSWLAAGTDAYVLMMIGGVPTWGQITSAGITNGTIVAADLAANAAVGNISNGTVLAVMLAAGAALSNLGFTPVPNTGGAMSDKLTIAKDAGANQVFVGLDIQNTNNSNSGGAIRLMAVSGITTIYHQYNSRVFGVNDLNGTVALEIQYGESFGRLYSAQMWDAAHDGSGSGLDADLLDAQDGTYYLARAHHTGTQLAATISDLATAVGLLTAAAANTIADGAVSTTAKMADSVVTSAKVLDGTLTDADVNAANKDGATGTASMRTLGTGSAQAAAGNHTHLANTRINTGSYTGNAGSRSVTGLGFSPRIIVALDSTVSALVLMFNGVTMTFASGSVSSGGTYSVDPDGFSFTNAASGANTLSHAYSYVAIG